MSERKFKLIWDTMFRLTMFAFLAGGATLYQDKGLLYFLILCSALVIASYILQPFVVVLLEPVRRWLEEE